MYLKYFKIFGVDKYVMRLSLHSPEKLGVKYVNEPELWKETEPWYGTFDRIRYSFVECRMKRLSTVQRSTCRYTAS
jgi:hypothetical protein